MDEMLAWVIPVALVMGIILVISFVIGLMQHNIIGLICLFLIPPLGCVLCIFGLGSEKKNMDQLKDHIEQIKDIQHNDDKNIAKLENIHNELKNTDDTTHPEIILLHKQLDKAIKNSDWDRAKKINQMLAEHRKITKSKK